MTGSIVTPQASSNTNKDFLKVLVCSGNLGNALPDEDSLASWIPADGLVQQVVNLEQPPKYPLCMSFSDQDQKITPDGLLELSRQGLPDDDQFDIIAIGMQESTFDPPKPEKSELNDSNHSEHSATKNILIQVPTVTKKQVKKGVQQTSKHVQKTLQKLSSLTSNLDHTKPKNTNLQQLLIPTGEWKSGTPALHSLLQARLPSYDKIVSYQRGEMRLEIFVLNKNQVAVNHVAAQNTGMGGLAANKGGIVAQLTVQGSLRLSFVTAHLEAHEGLAKYERRCESLRDILHGTRGTSHNNNNSNNNVAHLNTGLAHDAVDVTLTSHYTFCCGDLNFRTELDGDEALKEDNELHKKAIRELVARQDWQALNEADELQRALRDKDCLVGFQTPFCNFPPTFKLQREAGFQYVDQRRPSYTDRILWKTGHELETGVMPLLYEPCADFASSDHKPVRGAFLVQLNDRFIMRPRMTRRNSVKNMRRLLSKKKHRKNDTKSVVVAGNEHLHLFVSHMSCVLSSPTIGKKKQKSETVTNPYITLMAYPEEAISKHRSKWERFHRHIRFVTKLKKKKKKKGFLRSSVKKDTLSPDWGDEEMHAEINTHRSDGSAVDLTGAMLRVTVMDRRVNDDAILGSFSMNLVNLIRSCGSVGGRSSRRFFRKRSSNGSRDLGGGINNLSRSSEFMQNGGVPVDAPLLLDGQETGRIRFNVEAWWMNDLTAKASGAIPHIESSSNDSREMLTVRTDGQVYLRKTDKKASARTRRGGKRKTEWVKFSKSVSQ